MAAGDLIRMTIISELDGVAVGNSVHYLEVSPPGVPDAFDLIDAWANIMRTLWDNITSIECVTKAYLLKVLAPVEGPTRVLYVSDPGGVAGDAYPSNSHICITSWGMSEEVPFSKPRRNSLLKTGLAETWFEHGILLPEHDAAVQAFTTGWLGPATNPATGSIYHPKIWIKPPDLDGFAVTPLKAHFKPIARSSRRRTRSMLGAF